MITEENYTDLSTDFGIELAAIKAIDQVESNGRGFDPETGKIVIQFEPTWFKRISKLTQGFWINNKVELQKKEWLAFNDAFLRNPNAAMEATSIGRMQVMGFHWKRLGFKSVGAMWDFAKKSEANQLHLGLMFLKTDPIIFKAVLQKDWKTVAYRYNGSKYWVLGYDKKLKKAYDSFSKTC
jgi:hypothetical protein